METKLCVNLQNVSAIILYLSIPITNTKNWHQYNVPWNVWEIVLLQLTKVIY